ncbi:MAG: hypothetical protein NC217_07015 [Muribaculaceae bacterium]|nr:hypothetical protein [Muribaculaceae bacterium]
MKHLLSTALLCGMAVLTSNAQNIVVVDKDNISHRYHADYVQDITFLKGSEAQVTEVNFESLTLETWGLRNITMHFAQGEDTEFSLDIYQPTGYFLTPGEYTVNGSKADNTIDPGYSTLVYNEEKLDLASGSMTIALQGETYTINMDLFATNGQEFKGTYTGTVDKFGPIYTADLASASYQEITTPADNGFYYKFNDANWAITMRLDFFNSGAQLPNGVYTFADTGADGTVSTTSSYVDLASPYNESNIRFTEGKVTVSGEGASRTVKVEGKLSIGLEVDFTYIGTLPERPVVAPTADFVMNADAVNASAIWGMTNPYLTFTDSSNPSYKVIMDMHQPGTSYILPGTYEIVKVNNGVNTTDYYVTGVGSTFNLGSTKMSFNGGTLTVTLAGKTYTFDGLIELQNGKTLQFTYTGEMGNCGPAEPVGPAADYTIAANEVEINSYSSGANYSLNLVNTENKYEALMLDLYQTAKYYVQPGTYTVTAGEAAGTISTNASYSYYANDGTPVGFKGGEVVIALDGEIYTIEANITLVNDKTVKATYNGKLAYGPVANFTLQNVSTVNVTEPADNGFYYRFNDKDYATELRLDFFAEGTTTLPNGTYTFDTTGANGTVTGIIDLYAQYGAPISANNVSFKSGTVTVSGEGDNRTVAIDGVLSEQDIIFKATFTGALPERPYTEPGEDFTFNATACEAQSYGTRNVALVFSDANNTKLAFDLYHDDNWYMQAGTYTIAGTANGEINKGDASYTYFTVGDVKYTLASGEVVFTLNDQVYTMVADIVLNDGKKLHATYTGTLSCGPNTQEFTLSKATYVTVNNPAANGFYYRFSDSGFKIEARIDFFAEGTTTLPDGTYSFGDSGLNGTAQSLVDLYAPITLSSASFKSGMVTVATVDGNRVVTIEGVIGDENIPIKAVYTGSLPERPSSEGPKTYDYNFDATTTTAKNLGFGDWYVTMSGASTEKIVMSMAPATGSSLTPATYYIADDTKEYYTAGTSSNFYPAGSSEAISMVGGTVVVTKDGDVYTIVVDAVLENDETLYAKYTGTIE